MKGLSEPEEQLTIAVAEAIGGEKSLVALLESHVEALEHLAAAFEGYPSPLESQSLGIQQRDINSLLKRLTTQSAVALELAMPTRALVGRALVMARLNFFRFLRHLCSQVACVGDDGNLSPAIEENIAECVYQKAGDDLLAAIVCRSDAPEAVRTRAARLLLRLWHLGPTTELGDIVPVLAATWEARRRTPVALGTMLGASELFALLTSGCDVRFVDFLLGGGRSEEELNAFREFLFGLTWEELRALQESGKSLINVKDAQSPAGMFRAGDRAESFYSFLQRRHIHALNRSLLGREGPKMTAEQYVMEHLLAEHWDEAKGDAHL